MKPTMARLAPVLVAALVLHTATAGTSAYYWNDAGSGADAGNTRPTAMPLPGYGAYRGYLMPTDFDWYRLDAAHATASCVSVGVQAELAGEATLETVRGLQTRAATAGFVPGERATLAFAAPSVDLTRVGLVDPTVSFKPHANYTFQLARLGLGATAGDAGSGADASGMLSKALLVAPGCIGGRLDPLTGVGDTRDAFRVDAAPNATAVLSFAHAVAGGALTLQVLDASGVVLATLSNGGVAEVSVPTSGGIYLSASTMDLSSADYLIGLVVGPPGSSPCRPYCMDGS